MNETDITSREYPTVDWTVIRNLIKIEQKLGLDLPDIR